MFLGCMMFFVFKVLGQGWRFEIGASGGLCHALYHVFWAGGLNGATLSSLHLKDEGAGLGFRWPVFACFAAPVSRGGDAVQWWFFKSISQLRLSVARPK